MGKLEIYGIAAALILLAAFGWGAYKKHEGVTEERARWELKVAAATKADLDSLIEAVAAGKKISQDTFDALGKIRIVNTTINKEVQREVKTDVRYLNDCLPDSGVYLWNAAGRGVVPTLAPGTKPPVARPNVPPAK